MLIKKKKYITKKLESKVILLLNYIRIRSLISSVEKNIYVYISLNQLIISSYQIENEIHISPMISASIIFLWQLYWCRIYVYAISYICICIYLYVFSTHWVWNSALVWLRKGIKQNCKRLIICIFLIIICNCQCSKNEQLTII